MKWMIVIIYGFSADKINNNDLNLKSLFKHLFFVHQ